MMSTEIMNLRSELLLAAVRHVDAKWDAKQQGRSEDAEFHDRQYRQAKQAFNSLGGDSNA
jgi:hypothetical protein